MQFCTMKRNIKLRVLTYVVIAYMLLAFSWWTVLLFQKNQDAYLAKVEYFELISAAKKETNSVTEFQQTPTFQELTKRYKRQEYMILGEAVVFVISLVIGVWLINRGYNRAILAEEQNRNFLLSITHELKSPIASIRLTLETFLKRTLGKTQQDQLSTNALQETERLNTLVNDLLLAAKLEEAYQPVREDINLSDLIDEMIAKVAQKYPNASIAFEESNAPVHIEADRPGMTAVIINLLENAVKYSFENPILKVNLQSSFSEIVLSVADQGLGIPNKEKKKVFERFYRIGNEDTRKTKGTGLGLYIVNEIVLAHEGTIQILDNQPQGTVFKINLPT